jgi:polynucleotide 5'-hydroxyl-kinase GRC3/NOL9
MFSHLRGRLLRSRKIQVPQAVRGMHAFPVSPSWEATFSAAPFLSADEAVGLPKPHVLLVKGQKNSGKSTFARMLVNRLSFRYAADAHHSNHAHQLMSRYRRVAFLECDLGQSEFTPGGMVALNIIERQFSDRLSHTPPFRTKRTIMVHITHVPHRHITCALFRHWSKFIA